ncbi:MAG TPA: hypothetical protein VJ848_09320 [Candidatus Angelobacter sp.]|nr:hypothetical protein [Candidatus Angelobacter sp.]
MEIVLPCLQQAIFFGLHRANARCGLVHQFLAASTECDFLR